ncbi:MAG: hypothetical protein ACRC1F_02195 [Metamycoplasmataceae bacterium]
MISKLSKKFLFIGMSIILIAPFTIFLSCSSKDQSVENDLLDLEFDKNVQLKISNTEEQLSKINLLDLGSNTEQIDENDNLFHNSFNNDQLANIFVLPEGKSAETNEDYGIFYSWDFSKKNIVSFDSRGNIFFEVNVNVGLKTSNSFVTRPRIFTINIEETTIQEESQNIGPDNKPISITQPAARYIYNGIDENGNQKTYKFQAVRKDIFDKAKNFNIDFYSSKSLINNRPVIIENGATKESAVDAYVNERLIKPPSPTSTNETKYRFSVEQADFDESNPKKGIYKIRVSPENNQIFDQTFISYARETYQISFNKYYYYYEINATFRNPTESNISTHNSRNTTLATEIGNNIKNSESAFIPSLKNPGSIIGKDAEEIVSLNNSTSGGLFFPPIFVRQYSIEPFRNILIDITGVSATTNEDLTFAMVVKVGSGRFQTSHTIDKLINIKQLI